MDEKMVFGYVRVSTKDQNDARQISAIKAYRPEIEDKNIFQDKESGKTFTRENYQFMKKLIERLSATSQPIELIIEEFDRLGRNKKLVKDELLWFKDHNVTVRILNLPTTLIESSADTKSIMEMVHNILIEVLGTIAEQELVFREKRQREGIEIAKAEGKYRGRKPIQIDDKDFAEKYARWKSGELTAREAMRLLNLKPNTFYRKANSWKLKF